MASTNPASGPHRIPPQNLEAEQAILGTILQSPPGIHEVADMLTPESFYREAHRHVFAAMLALAETSEPVDLITVSTRLRSAGRLDEVGGPAYLASLSALVPQTAALPHYAAIVRDYARLRSIIRSAGELAQQCYEHQAPDVALDVAEAALMQILARTTGDQAAPMRVLAKQVFGQIEQQAAAGSMMAGLSTGYLDLDRLTGGLCPGDLTIIAGRPSMGKSALATCISSSVALESHQPVGIFSLEMPSAQVTMRMLADLGNLDLRRLRLGDLRESDWPRLNHAYGKLVDAPVFIDDTAGLTALGLRTRARRLKAKHNIGLLVVDYLQLMAGKGNNRENDVSEISRSLKTLAKELAIPVVALSQLNRELEKRPNKRPMLSDLRESGAIEQDADLILFVYRDEVYNKAEDNPRRGIAEVIIGKQRNGPTGTIELAWRENSASFENFARASFGAPA